MVSGTPSITFRFWMACPDAPLTRLSITARRWPCKHRPYLQQYAHYKTRFCGKCTPQLPCQHLLITLILIPLQHKEPMRSTQYCTVPSASHACCVNVHCMIHQVCWDSQAL